LNMLDLVLVTIPQHFQIDKSTNSAQEELLAQSTKREGGINFYTGMNDKGISYSGNKKLSTITGIEEIFDTPVQTVTGEDIGVLPNINVLTPLEGTLNAQFVLIGGPDNKQHPNSMVLSSLLIK
jgi:hypothetical protein